MPPAWNRKELTASTQVVARTFHASDRVWATTEREDTMSLLAKKVHQFLVSEDGPTAVEYAVMLALIVIVCLTAISSVGTNARTTFSNVAASLAASS
jgi:pilus assembly protein Flp/PilA